MNEDLKIFDLYKDTDSARINGFQKNINSEYEIQSNYEKVEVDLEWLEMMEETVRYIDNILRNPNRFIVNEEEVVKIELARKTTPESIKHLSRHTNFIEEIKPNGEVRPSKILNINKDESYNTYENRLVYTLIQNMSMFIEQKKKNLVVSSSLKDVKKCTYSAVSRVGAERIDMNLEINSRMNLKDDDGLDASGNDPIKRVEKVELQIMDLTCSEVYKTLAKLHVARVIPPIKKTNLILKNVNFQYAMKLWDYLQNNMANTDKAVKLNTKIKDDVEIKEKLDDVFLLNYLTVNSVGRNKDIYSSKRAEEEVQELTNKMITRIVELNADMPLETLQGIIGDKIAVVKNRKEASLSEIQTKIGTRIQSYLNRIESFRF